MKSIHILLPQQDIEKLKGLSVRKKKSVAEIIRQAISLLFDHKDASEKTSAFERLERQKGLHVGDWAKVKKELNRRYED